MVFLDVVIRLLSAVVSAPNSVTDAPPLFSVALFYRACLMECPEVRCSFKI